MPSASQLCSFPWDLYPYLQAHLLAHQQIILERLRAEAPVRTSVSPLCANTTNTQHSINNTRPTKLAKLSKSNCRKQKPRSGILSSAETQASNRDVEKFSENLPSEQTECEAQFTFKNQPLPNLKAVERARTQSTFKNYPYDPSSFEQVFFKLLRN